MKGIFNKRLFLTFFLFMVFVILVFISWELSSEDVTQTNDLSIRIADNIESIIGQYLEINHRDMFWKVTLNKIIRKAAHFIEYAVIGTVMCLMLNVAIGRTGTAALISIVLSPLFGLIDEYHQMFSPGRTSLLLDVYIDTAGILTGVITVTVFFLVYHYIMKLKYRINDLEKKLEIYEKNL